MRSEDKEEGKSWKRLAVMQNGLRAAGQLAAKNPTDDLNSLSAALDKLVASNLSQFEAGVRRGIKIGAEEIQITLKTRSRR